MKKLITSIGACMLLAAGFAGQKVEVTGTLDKAQDDPRHRYQSGIIGCLLSDWAERIAQTTP
jgi:hypothetical protein